MNKNININIYKPNRCVKSLSNAGSAKKEKGEAGNAKDQTSTVVKKKLNIPIGDVEIDADYEKNVPANFTLPSNFIRHTRRMGDEVDLLLDFVMDNDDESDKEVTKFLTPDTFEVFINLFEKLTGFHDNYITLIQVKDHISQSKLSDWPAAVLEKVLPDVYSYWVAKRNAIGKQNYVYGRALARKYWIPTTAGDTNPHNTFRIRDKEKYRLRRQQKRNDLESFRKLKQIRLEFGQARVLTQLVIEREKCREAALEVQRHVFEQTLFDAGLASLLPADTSPAPTVAPVDAAADSTASVEPKRRCATPFKHSLTFSHLLAASTPYSFDKSMLPPAGSSSGLNSKKKALAGLGDSLGFSTTKVRGTKKLAALAGLVPPSKQFKRKRSPEGVLVGGVAAGVEAAESAAPPPLPRPTEAPDAALSKPTPAPAHFEVSDQHLTALNAQFGAGGVASSFPSFMARSDLSSADVCPMLCSANGSMRSFLGDYMRDLQLRFHYSDGDESGGEAGMTVLYPDSYKVRGRVGRGGRMVLDRIPVYHGHVAHEEELGRSREESEQRELVGSSARAGYQASTGGMRVVYGTVLHPSRQQSRADRERDRESAHCVTVPSVPLPRFSVYHSSMRGSGGGGADNFHHYFAAPGRAQTAQFHARCGDVYAYPHVDNECVRLVGGGSAVQLSREHNRLLLAPEGKNKHAPAPAPPPELTMQYSLSV